MLHLSEKITAIEISPYANSDMKGITAIGTGIAGNSSKELHEPISISIHKPSNSLFIADHRNGRIQKLLLYELAGNGITVVNNLFLPLHNYVDDDTNQPAMYVTLSVESRIEKWRLGASKGVPIGDQCNDCAGLAVDKAKNSYPGRTLRRPDTIVNGNVYYRFVTFPTVKRRNLTFWHAPYYGRHLPCRKRLLTAVMWSDISVSDRIRSFMARWKTTVIRCIPNGRKLWLNGRVRHKLIDLVAGKIDQSGSTAELLSFPQGLYVTRTDDDIYVVDSANSRIQKWSKNSQQGITVAGLKNGIAGNDSTSLQNLINVFVDELTKVIYVADTYNHRIVRWLLNAIKGDVIADIGGQGNGIDQLNQPDDFTFGSNGNLYVADLSNNRIQLFRLKENNLCSSAVSVDGTIVADISIEWIESSRQILCLNIFIFMMQTRRSKPIIHNATQDWTTFQGHEQNG
ncbi:unnamed protein product [Rotaria magnacalcarata]|uniref:NHL repeat-containing protein n=1 Tax=Rotaria magnacalcarata TaxID=392030 RepID=A0A816Z3Y7_9BILA|nr:unnamed protein product [Rotaria magnacalcarata]